MSSSKRYRCLGWSGIAALVTGVSLCGSFGLSREAHPAATDVLIPGDRTFPESITSTSDGTLIVGSIAEGQILKAAPGATEAAPWIKAGTNGMLSTVGVLADEASGTLWSCSDDIAAWGVDPKGNQKSRPIKGEVKQFDLKTGTPKGSAALPGEPSFCNDIAIGPDRAAYITDSLQPHVLRLKPGGKEVEIWASDPRWASNGDDGELDGIAFGGDGQLYVNTFTGGGLYRIEVKPDGSAGTVTQLQTSQPLDHPDGMRRYGSNGLLLVEGDAGRFDIVRLSGIDAKIEVVKDGFIGPASVTQVGGTAYVLESKLKYLFDPNFQKEKPGPFRAYPIPLPESRR
jgi:sugar lactone lactonase YvrE